MAAQVSLPMLWLRSWRYGSVGSAGLWARSRGQFLGDDLLEKRRVGVTVGERVVVNALPGQVLVATGIEGWPALARGGDPRGELLCRHCAHIEMHVRKP